MGTIFSKIMASKVETKIEVVTQEDYNNDHVLIHGRWYVQKTLCNFRRAAIEKLNKIGPFGEVTELVDAKQLGHVDKKWTRYNQGITFGEQDVETNIAQMMKMDKDKAELAKLEMQKKDTAAGTKKTSSLARETMRSNNISFRVSDIYFHGDLDDRDVYKDNEQNFRDYVDGWKKEAHVGSVRLNFRQHRNTQKFNGTVIFSFEDKEDCTRMFNYIDGKDFNQFILRPEMMSERRS